MKEIILIHSNFQEKFSIFTDALEEATGGVLAQERVSMFKPIKYTSKLFSGPELRYSIYNKEVLAVIRVLHKFKKLNYLVYRQHGVVLHLEQTTREQQMGALGDGDVQVSYGHKTYNWEEECCRQWSLKTRSPQVIPNGSVSR
ncbi:hypothetical protein DSO57_1016602 [Entomophthora muscae]|uniref:Uncharacterized protein n=1 Tax=Entomophthora muscae TaxID=34485 RepID=A0ACC2SHI6_9FUNG|nr:hypothetical protein DSO57_1016602 [Entomophthora muscae]